MSQFLFQDEHEGEIKVIDLESIDEDNSQKSWHILIIDDEPAIHDVTRLVLKNNILARFQATLLIVLIMIAALFTGETQAAALQFSVTQTHTGGLVGALNNVGDDYCPAATSPGCDFSSSDTIVRTNDDIEFQFNVSVGPTADGPVILNAELDPGLLWPILPSSCNAFTSSMSLGNATFQGCSLCLFGE